jgi:lysophospholipase L1-like esterase
LYSSAKSDLGLGEFIALKQFYVDEQVARSQVAATARALKKIRERSAVSMLLVPDRYRFDSDLKRKATVQLGRSLSDGQRVELARESLELNRLAEETGIPLVDPNPIFAEQARDRQLAYPINGHLTAAGHALLAHALLEHSHVMKDLCGK